ncbi:MAG TPA: CoA-binding protein [Chthonomonadales bacterium]|nr:CoA-binding protein [Chthonomonadales bacterium]
MLRHSHCDLIAKVLRKRRFAVAGASRSPDECSHRVVVALRDAGYEVYPVNPNADEIAGLAVYPSLDCLPVTPDCVVSCTPPLVTERLARDAARGGMGIMWMQPGSGSTAALNTARSWGIEVVQGGPCIMVVLATRRRWGVP